MGLLALHCTELGEDSSVSEVCKTHTHIVIVTHEQGKWLKPH